MRYLLTLGLKVAVITRSTVTANQILKRVAMKNIIHYSKQNTANATRVIAALASLGQQTSHSLQSLCFALCNVIYYFIAPLLEIRFSVPAKRVETAIFNPRGETLKVGLQTSVSTRSTGAEKLVFSVRNVQIQCVNNIQKSDILVLVAFLRTSKRVRIISYHKIHCDPFFFFKQHLNNSK